MYDILFYLPFNTTADLYKMVCTENDTSVDINIPVVMIPKSIGKKIQDSMVQGEKGKITRHICFDVCYLCTYALSKSVFHSHCIHHFTWLDHNFYYCKSVSLFSISFLIESVNMYRRDCFSWLNQNCKFAFMFILPSLTLPSQSQIQQVHKSYDCSIQGNALH